MYFFLFFFFFVFFLYNREELENKILTKYDWHIGLCDTIVYFKITILLESSYFVSLIILIHKYLNFITTYAFLSLNSLSIVEKKKNYNSQNLKPEFKRLQRKSSFFEISQYTDSRIEWGVASRRHRRFANFWYMYFLQSR